MVTLLRPIATQIKGGGPVKTGPQQAPLSFRTRANHLFTIGAWKMRISCPVVKELITSEMHWGICTVKAATFDAQVMIPSRRPNTFKYNKGIYKGATQNAGSPIATEHKFNVKAAARS